MHKTAATPLTFLYAALVVYASLYPFADWRDQGIAPWEFLLAPPPRYWTGLDVAINMAGYMPLGGLLVLGALRRGHVRYALLVSCVLASGLSLGMEMAQGFLTARVPSREDWLLNTAGALTGAVATLALERWGAIERWSALRRHWFVADARGGLVLLATWPAALLFPPAVPFGLGQVAQRLEAQAWVWLEGTPMAQWLPWGPVGLQPLSPAAELLCVVLGLLIPCLLGFAVVPSLGRRLVLVPMVLGVGVFTASLSAAMSWGPEHAGAWMDAPTQLALVLALALAWGLALAPARACVALVLLALGIYLSLLNQAPESPYLSQTLQAWEQGRFIRFHGLAQWLGWLWPYAALLYALAMVWRKDRQN
jgi:VanZ family protein